MTMDSEDSDRIREWLASCNTPTLSNTVSEE